MATRRKDGRWVERFTYNGRRYSVYGKTKKEAVQNARRKQQEIENNTYIKAADLTLD